MDRGLARAADGLHTYRWDATSDSFVEAGPVFTALSDAAGYNQPSRYQTIQTGDVTGSGHAYLLSRAADGLHTYQWGQDGWTEAGPALTALSDANCGQPSCYRTIQTGDVTGDGKSDLLVRTSDGLRAYEWGSSGWTQVGGLLDLSDGHGWNQPQFYETIHSVHLDSTDQVDLIARGRAGVHTYTWEQAGWRQLGPTLTALSDQAGFNQAQYYWTIRGADLNGDGKDELLALNANGMAVYQWNGPQSGWTQLSANAALAVRPSVVEPLVLLHDPDGRGDRERRALLLARGPFGVRTFSWDPASRTFVRPMPYGTFPPFSGDEAVAYTALGRFLLGRTADFRKETYASPNNSITEAALDRYRGLLTERCTPVTSAQGTAPPTYRDCTPPPGSNVSAAAWTAVSNQIIAELWAAAGVVGYYTILDNIETKLFQDQQGSIPALDAAFRLPPSPPDRSATILKLIKSGLEIMGDVYQFFPSAKLFPRLVRAIALTAHSLGAVGEGLGLRDTPSPPQTYARIVDEIARTQQRERDVTEAQRRYVLADYGLLMTVGSDVNGRVLTVDSTAALSAGRQSFTGWIYSLYLPLYWNRYITVDCNNLRVGCQIPQLPTVRKTGPTSFVGVLNNDSNCHFYVVISSCTWNAPSQDLVDRVGGALSTECQYTGAPGSSAAWRYGCNLGVDLNLLIDNQAPWKFRTFRCLGPRDIGAPLCREVPATTGPTG